MTCLLILLLIAPEETLSLGAGKPWYDQNPAKAQTIEGILDYQAGSGRIGVPAGYVPFRVVRRDADTGKVQQFTVHAPGTESLLALHVGQRVKVEGKVVTKGEGAAQQEELWIGTMTTLGPAPLNVFTELKWIARSNDIQPNSYQGGSNISTLVIRSAKDAAKVMGLGSGPDAEKETTLYFAARFGVKAIDWKTQMIIYIGPVNQTRMSNKKREITKVEVNEKGITVFWKGDEMQQIGQRPSTDAILVPKVEGEATFKQVEGKKAENKPEASPEKLVPTAPVK